MRIIKINGFLYGLTNNNRLRKNWKNFFYKKNKPISKEDKCIQCNSKINLTRHHAPPLRTTIDSKILIYCEDCHKLHNYNEINKGVNTNAPFSIRCDKCKNSRYFLQVDKIQCKKCLNTIHLKKIKEDEFEVKNHSV